MGKGQMCVLYCDNFVIIFLLKQRSLRSINSNANWSNGVYGLQGVQPQRHCWALKLICSMGAVS